MSSSYEGYLFCMTRQIFLHLKFLYKAISGHDVIGTFLSTHETNMQATVLYIRPYQIIF